MSQPSDLVSLWRLDSSRFSELGQKDLAVLMARVAQELELALQVEAEREVTIGKAAEISGYTADYLRKMIKEKRLPARREGNRHWVKVSNLPRKRPRAQSVVDELAERRHAKGSEP